MIKIFLIFLYISLCVAENILERYKSKRDVPDEWPKPHKRMSNTIKFYADSDSSISVEYVLRNMNTSFCINFIKQSKKITDSGINFYKSSSKSDIILRDSKSKPTDIYLTESDINDAKNTLLLLYIGLALGLIPEITRYDRDDYVKVNLSNVDSKYIQYYKKTKSKTTYPTSFDYGSVLFLSSSFGSKNKKSTYTYKLSPYYDSVIGSNIFFTHNDNKRINFLYCSKKKCGKYKTCKNGSFPDYKCRRCICQEFFSGKKCEKLYKNDKKYCGNKQEYKSSTKSTKNLKNTIFQRICAYKIKSINKKKKVEITIKSLTFNTTISCNGNDGLFIHYRSDKSVSPLHLCKNVSKIVLPPSSSSVYIILKIPYRVKSSFEISYKSK